MRYSEIFSFFAFAWAVDVSNAISFHQIAGHQRDSRGVTQTINVNGYKPFQMNSKFQDKPLPWWQYFFGYAAKYVDEKIEQLTNASEMDYNANVEYQQAIPRESEEWSENECLVDEDDDYEPPKHLCRIRFSSRVRVQSFSDDGIESDVYVPALRIERRQRKSHSR